MNRYQKPEVYEKLAMEYVIGSMHGRARDRFLVLMEQYPFIAATVEEYEKKFSGLLEQVPEKQPSDKVWQGISEAITQDIKSEEKQIKQDSADQSNPWWGWVFSKGYALAAVFLLVSGIYLINTDPSITDANSAYKIVQAELVGDQRSPVARIHASKEVMKLSVNWVDKLDIPEGKQIQIWCLPKDGGQPMNMGAATMQERLEIALDQKAWDGLMDASSFAISYEPQGSQVNQPSGDYLFKGDIAFSL